ncbi:hypothetical protein DM01DRAFT_360360 [Hesseltinella vesiculosa]|uniref:Uncharacterized protein n=1 Tax=Hesseltinella vesiculosa TaxID=101127 RepID=A0A1X2GUI2_9FUNG|nr:hypothetical protein DM01DRAFT_360360 [Hesseltinella vesiculosa]
MARESTGPHCRPLVCCRLPVFAPSNNLLRIPGAVALHILSQKVTKCFTFSSLTSVIFFYDRCPLALRFIMILVGLIMTKGIFWTALPSLSMLQVPCIRPK